MCKCKAKDVNYRLSLIEKQAQLTDWSTASHIAQDRWRKVMLWFHFLWGRKADCAVAGEHARTPASPYLDLGRDKHLFEQILLSALKGEVSRVQQAPLRRHRREGQHAQRV